MSDSSFLEGLPEQVITAVEPEYRYRMHTLFATTLLSILLACYTSDKKSVLLLESPFFVVVACTLCLVGLLFRAWASGYLSMENIMSQSAVLDKLVTNGPYAFTRNPLYVGSFLIFWSINFLLNFTCVIVMGIVLAIRTFRLVMYEEKQLAAKVGSSFAAFKNTVPRLVPNLNVDNLKRFGQALAEKTDWQYGIKSNASLGCVLLSEVLMYYYPSFMLFFLVSVAGAAFNFGAYEFIKNKINKN